METDIIKPKIFQTMMECQKSKKRQPQTIIEIIDLKISIMEVLILKITLKKGKEGTNGRYGHQVINKR